MIARPTKKIATSVTKHNVDLNVLCDWVEASVLFLDDELSKSDIVDTLLEEEIYAESEFAYEMVSNVWIEIKNRIKLCGPSYCINIVGDWIRRIDNWNRKSAHVFCLLLSLATNYDWWSGQFGQDYTDQGLLFEKLTNESIRMLSPNWDIFHTGWSKEDTAGRQKIAKKVSDIIHNGQIDTEMWNDNSTGDLGLDLILYRPFRDGRKGFTSFFIQCASGGNWKTKTKTPDIAVWRRLLNPDVMPVRGFAVPFCLSDKEFRECSVLVEGVLFERNRLLGAAYIDENWVPDDVKQGIIEWSTPRIEGLRERSL